MNIPRKLEELGQQRKSRGGEGQEGKEVYSRSSSSEKVYFVSLVYHHLRLMC